MRKVEAGAALPKAVNIVAKSVGTTSKMFRSNHQGSAFFKEAGPVGTVLCPAETTICTAIYQGKGKYPPGKPQYKKGNVFNHLGLHQTGRFQPLLSQKQRES